MEENWSSLQPFHSSIELYQMSSVINPSFWTFFRNNLRNSFTVQTSWTLVCNPGIKLISIYTLDLSLAHPHTTHLSGESVSDWWGHLPTPQAHWLALWFKHFYLYVSLYTIWPGLTSNPVTWASLLIIIVRCFWLNAQGPDWCWTEGLDQFSDSSHRHAVGLRSGLHEANQVPPSSSNGSPLPCVCEPALILTSNTWSVASSQ